VGIGQVKRAVFLDRDGVLNRATVDGDGTPHPPATVEELTIYPEAPDCLQRLRQAGFLTIVVTNQPDVARGTQTRAAVDAINRRLESLMPIDDLLVCDHDGNGCHCRKPKPGMLTDAARKHGIDLGASYMVGDRYKDIEAGQRAGCAVSIWIDHGNRGERAPEPPYERAASLGEATDRILRRESDGGVQ
jgi:D-glycero-D-manno-heptose 1,7-bisphosphate phosphatase